MLASRPLTLVAELTYRCPLRCPYCSNPLDCGDARYRRELTTEEWVRVFREARSLGVLQLGLSGGEPLVRRDLEDLVAAAAELGLYSTLVTSAVPMMTGGTGNLYLSGRHALLAEHRAIENAPNGLGDLMSALFLARLLEGVDDEKALQLATASVFEILARTKKRDMNELTLETDSSSLSTPMAMVQMRHLLHPSRSKRK